MERMNLKKTNPEIREYVKSRIIEFKEKGYAVKEIGELLNINDDYAYQVLKKYRKNGNNLPIEKVRGRKVGEGRRLPQEKVDEIKAAIIKYTPD
ncbi:MAG: helix-turn-helix domain-containing protein, partial [Selenomonadaceae bacterium]|nr:helix-turn-helix domain-containing protein [Selenomonadaceae bacterium]